jgi:Fur family transcriptional regulator, ferric uptake regulator
MESQLKLFETILRKKGYFITRARSTLFKVLQTPQPLSMQQLVAKLPRQDQASVYRNAKLFEELGVVNKVRLGWKFKLELSDLFQRHHHHLTCINCQKTIDLINDVSIELSIAQVANQQGFIPLDHQLEISGYCQNCQ